MTLLPALTRQIALFSTKLPQFITTLQSLIATEGSKFLAEHGGPWLQQFGLGQTFTSDQIQKAVGDLVSSSGAWLLSGLKNLAVGGAALVGLLSFVIITPVVAFYILVDWHKMVDTLDSWLPREHRTELRETAGEIDLALAGFLRGQSLVCVFLGLWYGIGLTLIGLDFALLIGFLGGLLSFIPYVGSLTALVLALSVAIVQKWPEMHLFLMALGVIGSGQFMEGYVISPKLVGESIGLHPVWLIFALFAFGELFGFTGLLVAVPTAAALGVIVRRLIRSYQMSPLYRGRRPAAAGLMSSPRQLPLPLPHEPSFAREDFLASPSNAAAISLIEDWPRWPAPLMLLVGPAGSGKSHLAAIFAEISGARAARRPRPRDPRP